MSFQALLLTKTDAGQEARIEAIEDARLPENGVVVRVDSSSLNYKDALAITGKAPVVRSFPMIPGIDLAGTIETSSSPSFREGDRVLVNGWGLGESHWGGMAQRASVKADWLVPMPEGLTARQAMGIGTAGYTAMLCVMALERHGIGPDSGEVVVTGASGGVGGIAIALLAARGYRVVASTGRPEEEGYLKALGAGEIIRREELGSPGKPLGKERWAAGIDSVGGHTLANLCATTRYGGVVAACGLAQSMELPASVAPFILRGITLAGIDSVYCPMPQRIAAWKRLGEELRTSVLETMISEIGLGGASETSRALLEGRLRGRVVVDVNR